VVTDQARIDARDGVACSESHLSPMEPIGGYFGSVNALHSSRFCKFSPAACSTPVDKHCSSIPPSRLPLKVFAVGDMFVECTNPCVYFCMYFGEQCCIPFLDIGGPASLPQAFPKGNSLHFSMPSKRWNLYYQD
jgi:hypothetical protein